MDVDEKFDEFITATSNSINPAINIPSNLGKYYVIYCFLVYKLKKIESVSGFDTVLLEYLNEESNENTILRRIRTSLEVIVQPCYLQHF